LLGFAVTGRAQSLDATFNPGANDEVYAIAVQADGKILVGGAFTMLGGGGTGSTTRNYIGRLNADGSLDTAFNPGANGAVSALAIQSDGKILVGGYFTGLVGSFETGFFPRNHIGRLNVDGSLDTSFNPGAFGAVVSFALQSDGKILVGGESLFGRISPSGAWEASFDRGPNGTVWAVALRSNGNAVFGGDFYYLDNWLTPCNRIAFLNADGSLNAYATGDGANDYVGALARQADGKILLGGLFTTLGFGVGLVGSAPRNLIGRLNLNGSLDTSFNPSVTSTNGYDHVNSLAIQSDGKVIVGGYFSALGGGTGAARRDYLGRLNANGSLDTTFNPGIDGSVNTLVLQADGSILVGGDFTKLGGGGSGTTTRNYLGRFVTSPVASPSLSIADASVDEGNAGNSLLPFTLSLSAASASNVSVNYAVTAGSATAGSDYTASSGTFVIPAGALSKKLLIVVKGDADIETNETLTVTLSSPSGAVLDRSVATGVIANDDPASSATLVTQYRLYHDGTKEHLYTTDLNEYNVLGTRGWILEGIAYKMLTNGMYNGVATVPLFRLYHPGILQHHWTPDSNEALVLGTGSSWFYEGTIGYLLPTQVSGTVPLYRMNLASPPIHLWTTDLNEYNTLATRGWVKEGVVGYVIP